MNEITKKQFLDAYNSAPDFVRAVFNDEKTTHVVVDLQARFKLHVDNTGLISKGVGYMLLGILKPEEFLQKLITAGIPDTDARQIVTEINQKIFIPLREQMRKGPVITIESEKSDTSEIQSASVISKTEPQTQTPPRFFHLENKLAARNGAIPPRPSAPTPAGVGAPTESVGATKVAPVAPQPKPTQSSPLATAIGNVLNAQPKVAPQPPRPFVAPSIGGPRPSSNIAPLPPKFMSPRPSLKATEGAAKSWGSQISPEPRKMLEDHEELHIELPTSPKATQGTAIAPIQPIPQVPPRPSVAPSVGGPNLPGAMPPVSIPGMPSMPEVAEVHTLPIVPKIEPPMPLRQAASMPITPPKSYSVDPYREPIE